jgi:hypothetical protein
MATNPIQTKTPPTVVTVQGGVATPDPANVDSSGQVQFVNSDPTSYRILELSLQGAVDGQATLPAEGSVTIDVGPNDATFNYRIVAIDAQGKIDAASAGGGRIIINP